MIEADGIIIDAKSGVSGAGKKKTGPVATCEEDKNFFPYKVNKHQHAPEMIEIAKRFAGAELSGLTFVPHLLPVERGLLATMYVKKKKGVSVAAMHKTIAAMYADAPFVDVKDCGSVPMLSEVVNTNMCGIGICGDDADDTVVLVSAIDNLVKGASGQAIQNMNICCGFKETVGLINS